MFDVCLVLEGTYPYLIGGVAAWVDDHLRALPDHNLAVVHLRDCDQLPPARRYAVPGNATILDVALDPERDWADPAEAAAVPEARVYHGLATGAAGSLASRTAAARGRPFLLTEHGLAWREAAAGISGCKPHRVPERAGREARERLAAAVRGQARENYARAAAVTGVCSANAALQRGEGASVQRLHVIPNATGRSPIARSTDPASLRIGLVGRVTRIKDVETFVRACALAAPALPAAEFVVVGPLDHEPDYALRCRELTAKLGLAERLRFVGERPPGSREPLDVVVLTSLSEGQPRVLIDALAAGVPVIATAVGGCVELVGGPHPAGLLTPVADPRAIARAIVTLGRDRELRYRLGSAGRRRVRSRHAPERVHRAWRALYGRIAEQPAAA